MSVTCSSCGKSGLSSHQTTCPVCGNGLPGAVVQSAPKRGGLPAVNTTAELTSSTGRRYRVSTSAPTLIGSRGCGITLADPNLPARAAKLVPFGGGYAFEDLGAAASVNGRLVSGSHSLQSGDVIRIGATELVYRGPSASPAVISGNPKGGASSGFPVVYSLPKPAASTLPAGIVLKQWGGRPPIAEGSVELVNGPYRMDKGGLATKLAASAVLGLLSRGYLSMIPFMGKQEVDVWFLRVKDFATRKLVSVVLSGEPSALPQLGDFVAVWGLVKNGNIVMEMGYSYTTDSEIRIRRR